MSKSIDNYLKYLDDNLVDVKTIQEINESDEHLYEINRIKSLRKALKDLPQFQPDESNWDLIQRSIQDESIKSLSWSSLKSLSVASLIVFVFLMQPFNFIPDTTIIQSNNLMASSFDQIDDVSTASNMHALLTQELIYREIAAIDVLLNLDSQDDPFSQNKDLILQRESLIDALLHVSLINDEAGLRLVEL